MSSNSEESRRITEVRIHGTTPGSSLQDAYVRLLDAEELATFLESPRVASGCGPHLPIQFYERVSIEVIRNSTAEVEVEA